jgi:hypothetical protein
MVIKSLIIYLFSAITQSFKYDFYGCHLLPTVKPEGSLPCSQKHASGHYPDQVSSVHTLKPYCFKINFNIILLHMLRFPKSSLPFRFSEYNFVCMLHIFPTHLIFCFITQLTADVKSRIMKLLMMHKNS